MSKELAEALEAKKGDRSLRQLARDLGVAPGTAEGWVFPGRFEGHAHTGSIYLWVGRIGKEAGVRENRRNPHALRHTCLTRMYEETGDIRLVQQFAGHADPAQTAKYTRVPRKLLVAAIGRVDYRSAA